MAKKQDIEDVEATDLTGTDAKNITPADKTAGDNITDLSTAQKKPDDTPTPADKNTTTKPAGGIAEPKASTSTNTQNVSGIKFNFSPNDVAKDILSKKPAESTAEAVDEGKSEKTEEPTEEEKRAYIAGELDEAQKPMTVEELMEVSELVIDLIDTINSTAVGAFAGEKASKFELEASKRKRLAGFLARVFFKYQVKMGPVAGLVIAALLYFGLTWKMGYDIKKEKKIDAERKAADDQKEKNRQRKDAFRNKVIAQLGDEHLTLKKLSDRMGLTAEGIKPEIELMLNLGTIKADHSDGPIKYSLA